MMMRTLTDYNRGDSMKLIQANIQQLDVIMNIIEDGRIALKNLGIDQWQGEYPAIDNITDDIHRGISYLLVDDDQYVATVAVDPHGEAVYDTIEKGSWASDEPYITVHRMAVSLATANKGVGTHLLTALEQLAKELQFSQIRLDTHERNIVMQRVAEKNNYRYAGIVNYGEDVDFDCVAYDKSF
ncbi:GNAT family N-acetyltransferase [Kurthia sibirica]|uniref:GNAT family N-acetyltransferase n=2 Tax=Kurthia sibirica TaxID=202750 RepID=A0A2U3ALE7_9BACL|nr:GNAT family N-acetyltransferase [Kurthia sibirica]